MDKEQRTRDDNNRRSFYRLQDKVYIEFRAINELKARELMARYRNAMPQKDEDSMYLDQLGRQLSGLLATARSESPTVTQCLELMNRKMDFLAGMLFFERFRAEPSEPKTVKTSTVDISEGGLSFNSKIEYPEGTHLALKMVVVSARIGIETVGKVVNNRALTRKGVDYFRVGLEFPYLPESDRRVLSRYIMDRQREQIRSVSEPGNWAEEAG